MRKVLAAMAVFAVGCGGGADQTPADTAPAVTAQPAAEAPMAGNGTVHEVEMELTADGQYVYEPASLTIKVGDTVRWLNVSGFPHNVAFYADQIPEGAETFLTAVYAADAGKIGPMSGRLMVQAGDVYEITFVGAPTGSYGYFCTPHEALGMKATLTVE
ncbi:MAG TPA: plastocyanin/azurin family copper-binding protein [Gemmatimonadales bacterium]|jgi:plastocyanin